MAYGRWYPSLITLGDGRVLAVAGFTKYFPWVILKTIEVYTPGQGWRPLRGADRWLPLYPRLHLLPNGEVFYSGSFNTHYTFPFTIRGFPIATLNLHTGTWRVIGLPNTSQREEDATVFLPLKPPDYRSWKVLLAGGGSTPNGKTAVPDAEIIDLAEENPRWRRVQPMKHARYHAYAVLLPDRQVLVVGGRSGERGDHDHAARAPQATERHLEGDHSTEDFPPQDSRAIREAELFNPDTEQWSTMAAMQVDRLYHSNALLLPDGCVMVAGSNPASRVNELRIEIYHPPYLFKGPRPCLVDAPSTVSYGEEITIATPDANAIDEVTLIRPISTTHCFSTDQRYVGLAITGRSRGTVVARIPNNCNLAPAGYYMLFILSEGIPSEAKFIHLR